MEYYFSKMMDTSFDDAVQRTTEILKTEVSAVNPVASMMAIQNKDLESIALEITEKLKRVIETL